jgi:hypothetical protein
MEITGGKGCIHNGVLLMTGIVLLGGDFIVSLELDLKKIHAKY